MAATSILGRYRYISRLGAGGSSTVMLAEDTLLGRRVALKRIHTSDDVAARSRLRREALIGASVAHPNLVSIFDFVTTADGDDVIVMEYVEGETLADRLRRGNRPELSETLRILDGLSAALDAIHERKIVHRDVKPANVLLGRDGVVKLADLGIAAVPDRTQITTGEAVIGTFRYMAPEQLEGGRATPAVDIYALAAVAFEALSGEKARNEPNPLALAHAIASQPPPDLRRVWPEAPAAAAEVLIHGMSRDPGARPRSAGELTAQLRAALRPRARTRMVPVPSAAPAPTRRPTRVAPVAAAGGLLAAAAAAAVIVGNSGSSHQSAARVKRRPATAASASPPASSATTGKAPAATDGSPASTVESFYHLAASHQFAAAWTLADPAFRQQMQGYQGLQGTFARTRSVTFDGINVVNQSPTSAVVALRTTSVQDGGTQNCSGTADLLRSGSGAAWLLNHISVQCA